MRAWSLVQYIKNIPHDIRENSLPVIKMILGLITLITIAVKVSGIPVDLPEHASEYLELAELVFTFFI